MREDWKELLEAIDDWCINKFKDELRRDLFGENMTVGRYIAEEPSTNELYEVYTKYLVALWSDQDYEALNEAYKIAKKGIMDEVNWINLERAVTLSRRIKRIKREQDKRYRIAQGYEALGNLDMAVNTASDLVDELPVSSKLAIDVRLSILEWLDEFYEADEWQKNIRILMEVVTDPEDREELIEKLIEKTDYWDPYTLDVLKKENDSKWFEYYHDKIKYMQDVSFANLYEALKPTYKLSLQLYLLILVGFEKRGKKKEALEVLETVKKFYPNEYKDSIFEEREYRLNNEWDKALDIACKLIENNPNDEKLITLKAIVLFNQGKYQEALGLFDSITDKEVKYRRITDIVECNLKLGKTGDAVTECIRCNDAYGEMLYKALVVWLAKPDSKRKFLIRLLNRIDKVNYENLFGVQDLKINYVLKSTSALSTDDKGIIRYELLRLGSGVQKIKDRLRLREEVELYHYTKSASIQLLPEYEAGTGGSPLRLGNVAYLNDPQEGEVFYKLIDYKKKDENKYDYQNAYLVSLSLSEDSLPMWVQYADDGKGCCYEINSSYFTMAGSYYNSFFDNQKASKEKYRPGDNELYKVYYVTNGEVKDKIISNSLATIKIHLENLSKYNLTKRISDIVDELLNSVRFLFKDNAYAAEKEVRLIMIDYENKKKIDKANFEPPHFYMDNGKALDIDRVILGPKSTDNKAKVTYLKNCRNVKDVSLSAIKYE